MGKFGTVIIKINNALGYVSGALVFGIGLLTVFESLSRSLFDSPTSWSMDICSYMLIWLLFLGCAYAYQTKGHVAVDLLRDIVEKRWGKKPRIAMALAGWAMVLVLTVILLRAGLVLMLTAIQHDQLTINMIQIPAAYLILAIVVGSVIMILTVLNIFVEVIRGNDEYI